MGLTSSRLVSANQNQIRRAVGSSNFHSTPTLLARTTKTKALYIKKGKHGKKYIGPESGPASSGPAAADTKGKTGKKK